MTINSKTKKKNDEMMMALYNKIPCGAPLQKKATLKGWVYTPRDEFLISNAE